MHRQEIIVTVSPEGEVEIEAVGFTGSSCEAATRDLEAALGVSSKRELKAEYHQVSEAHVTVGS